MIPVPDIVGIDAASGFDVIENRIEAIWHEGAEQDPVTAVSELLRLGEEVLEAWIVARGETPTDDTKEGFRLLALHRQGAKGDPSFNACRETCRELIYHYNLIVGDRDNEATAKRLQLAAMVAKHLCLFVSGKMQVAGLGEFCCSAKPLRADEASI
jgi:hypothetical protein